MPGRNRIAASAAVLLTAFLPSCARNDAADLDKMTGGMLIGRSPTDKDLIDVAFPGDMLPDASVIREHGKSAHLVPGIRIAEGKPILMVKVVHFSAGEPLGVYRMWAAAGVEREASYYFEKEAILRQNVDSGVLEFATMVPSHDEQAKKVLNVILGPSPCEVVVDDGHAAKTTFRPSKVSIEHAQKMADLYAALAERPNLIPLLQQRSLSFEEFQKALMK